MQNEREQIKALIAQFPSEFGLRAFPGKVFSISEGCSYWSEYEGAFLLYTAIKQENGTWLSFAKGTANELRTNMVKL